MTQRRSRRNSHSSTTTDGGSSRTRRDSTKPIRERRSREDAEFHTSKQSHSAHSLTSLIERDAPLYNHSGLVLMYGPFQAEMAPEKGQGVASWIRDCVHKHGIPSLLRFDYGRRAQIFRRDQFQPWLEPLLVKIPS
jgi:hypothetical protein